MMRSLSSAVGGLRAHQTKMDVIGNNIANVNTYGFKSSRTTFSDVYYQTLSSGSRSSETVGGTNPTQIGYGAVVATIDVLNTQAGMASTDRALDLYIDGDGMIATKDANGNLKYSRLGILGFDAEGNLVDANGAYVQGMGYDKDGKPLINADGTIDIDDLSNITVDTAMLDKLTGISIGTTGEITGVLPGDPKFSMTKGVPDWLQDIIIAEDSNMSGNVTVTMAQTASYTAAQYNLPSWITSVSATDNMDIDGTYIFAYDPTKTKNNITVSGPNGETFTGTYTSRGDTVEVKDPAGNVVMTMETDTRISAAAMSGDTVTFTSAWELEVSGYNKAGVAESSSVTYDDPSRIPATVNFADLGITLSVDASLVEDGTKVKITNQAGSSAYSSWLSSSYMDPNVDTVYADGAITLDVYREFSATASPVASANWADKTALKGLMEALGTRDNYSGNYSIGWAASGTGVQYTIYNSNTPPVAVATSSVVANTNADVIFTVGGTTYNLGASKALQTSTVSGLATELNQTNLQKLMTDIGLVGSYSISYTDTSGGAPYAFTITGPGSYTQTVTGLNDGAAITFNGINIGTIPTGGPTFASGTPVTFGTGTAAAVSPYYKIGTVADNNVIKATDASGADIGQVNYTGGDSVKLGDLFLTVDETALLAYFGTNPNQSDTIAALNNEPAPKWAFDGKAGSAGTGEGEVVTLGIIALANFANVAAMKEAGSSYFIPSANSGEATFSRPGLNNTGTLKAGYLEMSNVDIAKEFTDMITTQRGFQANTRIITVSDEMLQELVNLKR